MIRKFRRQSYSSSMGGDENEEMGIDLTSLMDVIFILLIFFVLTSGTAYFYTDIQIPKTKEKTETNSPKIGTKSILIELPGKKEWKINGESFLESKLFEKKLIELGKLDSGASFILAPERNLPVEELIQLLNFLTAHQIQNVQVLSRWKE